MNITYFVGMRAFIAAGKYIYFAETVNVKWKIRGNSAIWNEWIPFYYTIEFEYKWNGEKFVMFIMNIQEQDRQGGVFGNSRGWLMYLYALRMVCIVRRCLNAFEK